jgi:heptosyltransferase I
MSPLIATPPESLCILRLSAIGDVCHVVPVLRTLQTHWPTTRISWIIGKTEAKLLGGIPDVEFITVDKRNNMTTTRRLLRDTLRGRRFDLLLHMQLSLRSSIVAAMTPARIKLGFDRRRARELQWMFTNQKIRPAERQHVLDSLFGFAERLGIYERELRWEIPLPEEAQAYARDLIPDGRHTLVISPCSSHSLRNWRAEHYATVADHAASVMGLQVLLCGGRSEIEQRMGADIEARMREPVKNVIGRDTLIQMLAVLERATVLISPDSGPAHMATAVGTPVVGLYAATNPSRSGPYLSRQWCVDKYEAAAQTFLKKPASQIPWTKKIELPGVMDLITPEDVIKKLHSVMLAVSRKRLAAARRQSLG